MKKIILILVAVFYSQVASCSLSSEFDAFITRGENAEFLNLYVSTRRSNLINDIQTCLKNIDEFGPKIGMSVFEQVSALLSFLKACCEIETLELCCSDDGYEVLEGDRFAESKARMINMIEQRLIPQIFAEAEIN